VRPTRAGRDRPPGCSIRRGLPGRPDRTGHGRHADHARRRFSSLRTLPGLACAAQHRRFDCPRRGEPRLHRRPRKLPTEQSRPRTIQGHRDVVALPRVEIDVLRQAGAIVGSARNVRESAVPPTNVTGSSSSPIAASTWLIRCRGGPGARRRRIDRQHQRVRQVQACARPANSTAALQMRRMVLFMRQSFYQLPIHPGCEGMDSSDVVTQPAVNEVSARSTSSLLSSRLTNTIRPRSVSMTGRCFGTATTATPIARGKTPCHRAALTPMRATADEP